MHAGLTALRVTDGTAPEVGAEVVGTASDLLLWLWGRCDLDRLRTTGDRDVVVALRLRLGLLTG